MQFDNDIQIWLTSAMFGLGLLVFILGLWILILPARFLKTGQSLGKWVSTEEYFDAMDKPRYQESLIYRHHRIAGSLIVLGAAYTLLMLIARADISAFAGIFPTVINPFWSEWFYGALYSMLLVANMLAIVVGLIVLIRPSILKGIEMTLNRWIVPESRLKKLDEPHEISVDVFPGGNPRLFGLAVTLAGLYIMLSMTIALL
jgi:hypothetical protein